MAHLEVKGAPISIVLDVVKLTKVHQHLNPNEHVLIMIDQSHSGLNLALAFVDILKEFKIKHKILSVTCDNTSNNDTMVSEMEKSLTEFSEVNRTRCFAHILNLIAKSLLKQFDMKQKMEEDLTDDEHKLLDLTGNIEEEENTTAMENNTGDEDTADEDDMDGWVNEMDHLTTAEKQDLEESIKPVRVVLVKVKVNNKLTNLAHHMTPTASQTFFQNYSLNNDPPANMETMHEGPATSRSYHIDTYFTTMACNVTKLVSIRATVGLAQKTLNRYYSLTDSSEVYRIIMSE